MKKVFYSIFAAVLAVACTTFEVEEPLQIVNVDKPVISDVVVGETTISAKLTPKEGTSFYSYAVIAGPAAELDPSSLFKLGYKSKAVVSGTVDASKNASFTVEAGSAEKPLSRDADYTIYAVAASTQGTIGEIASQTVHTGDTDAPRATGTSAKGNVITVKFSEKVSLVEGKVPTAKYYALNLVKLNAAKTALASDGLQGDAKVVAALAADGKSADFTVTLADGKPLPDGALFAVSYPAGTFKDNLGNEMAGLNSGPAVDDQKIVWGGAVAQIATKAFALATKEENVDMVVDLTAPIVLTVPEGVTLFSADSKAKGSIVYEGEGYSSTYVSQAFVVSSATEVSLYPYFTGINAPNRGDGISLTIPADYLTDIYGNKSSEFSLGPLLFSYGYTIADVVGEYENDGTSGYGPTYNEAPWSFVLAASDNASKGNVMVTSWYGMATKIYADFDLDRGIFTMPLYYEELEPTLTTMPAKYGSVEEYNAANGTELSADDFAALTPEQITYDLPIVIFWYTYGYFCCSQKTKEDLVLYMTAAGEFTDGEDYPGYYYEIYKWPASGNSDDIKDSDFVDYDYNVFNPEFSKKGSAPAPAHAARPANGGFKTFNKGNFRR